MHSKRSRKKSKKHRTDEMNRKQLGRFESNPIIITLNLDDLNQGHTLHPRPLSAMPIYLGIDYGCLYTILTGLISYVRDLKA